MKTIYFRTTRECRDARCCFGQPRFIGNKMQMDAWAKRRLKTTYTPCITKRHSGKFRINSPGPWFCERDVQVDFFSTGTLERWLIEHITNTFLPLHDIVVISGDVDPFGEAIVYTTDSLRPINCHETGEDFFEEVANSLRAENPRLIRLDWKFPHCRNVSTFGGKA